MSWPGFSSSLGVTGPCVETMTFASSPSAKLVTTRTEPSYLDASSDRSSFLDSFASEKRSI